MYTALAGIYNYDKFYILYCKSYKTLLPGYPSNLLDEEDIDWAPTINLGLQKVKPISECALKRQKRAVEREEKRQQNQAALALLSLADLIVDWIEQRYSQNEARTSNVWVPGNKFMQQRTM